MMKIIFSIIISTFLFFNTNAQEVTVAVSSNFQFAIEDITKLFEEKTGLKVKTVTGSSGNLTAQIKNGAPFDLFLSADMKYPENLFNSKYAVTNPRVYAYGKLILWTMKDVDLSKGIEILKKEDIEKIAIANPELAPYGSESINSLKYHNLYNEIKNKLVFGRNVSQVNQYITTKTADAGFTAMSVVMSSDWKDKGNWIELDQKSYSSIEQGVVILKHGKEKNEYASERFFNFLFSDEVKTILLKYGYGLNEQT